MVGRCSRKEGLWWIKGSQRELEGQPGPKTWSHSLWESRGKLEFGEVLNLVSEESSWLPLSL